MTAQAELERFERLYAQSEDPWDYRESGYEQQKYQATLGALPRARYGLSLEVGCSIGLFTAQLAERCERLVAIDFSPRALTIARQNLHGCGNVDLALASFPEQAPEGAWELVVCSEVLYYLDDLALERAIAWISSALLSGASVLAVSWRGEGRDEPQRGDQLHDRLASELSGWHALDARQERYRLDRFDGR